MNTAGGRRMSMAVAIVVGAALLSASLAVAAPASAADHRLEQAAGGLPSWVVPGIRITHYTAVATLPDGSYELVEDPNGPLTDPVTGKRYRESYTSSPQATAQGGTGSGDGFLETTIFAVEGDEVILSRTLFMNEPLTATRSSGSTTAERVAGARVEGAWIRPDLLTTMKTGDIGSVLVLRGPVTVAGTTYEAVSLVDPTAGSYSSVAYDAASGVLLSSALRMSAISGGPLQMSLMELRGVRQLSIPGLGAAVPGWLAAQPELVYSGTQVFVNPMDSLSQPMSSEVAWRTKFPQTGATWAMYETTATVTMLGVGTPLSSSGVVSGTGPYWWDPAALAAMTAGQALDADPHTGLTSTVTGVVQGAFGPAVEMAVTMPGLTVAVRYDTATGVMIYQEVAITSLGTTTEIILQQMPAAALRP